VVLAQNRVEKERKAAARKARGSDGATDVPPSTE